MTTINKDLIPALNNSLELTLPDNIQLEELKQKLALHINHLINHNFEKLVSLLYRIDVNENKIRQLLKQKRGKNAAGLIADLIIERQLQKIESRRKSANDETIPDDEKW
jgi:uncharacterized protein YwgA